MSAAHWHRYLDLLWHGDHRDRVLRTALDAWTFIAPDDDQRLVAARYALAACARNENGEYDAAQRSRISRFLEELSGSDAPRDLRIAALRHYASLQRDAPERVRERLLASPALVNEDPWLRYTHVYTTWITSERSTLSADDSLRLIERLKPAIEAGIGHAAVLTAEIHASAPLRDVRAAAAVLEVHWDLIAATPSLLPAAVELRAQLLVDLGLVEAAQELIQTGAGEPSPELLLKIARAVADRDGGSIGQVQRSEAVGLVKAAIANSLDESTPHASRLLTAARLLIDLEAYGDAEQLLASQAGESMKVALLFAEAQLRGGKVDSAVATLTSAMEIHPEAADLWLLLAEARLSLDDLDRAADCYRRGRSLSGEGSSVWWQATLGLAEVLDRSGRRGQAQDLARVVSVLYSAPPEPRLQRRLQALLHHLEIHQANFERNR